VVKTTFKYQARKNFKDGSYVEINTDTKKEFDDFYQAYLFPTKANAETTTTKPKTQTKKPTKQAVSICEICGSTKELGEYNGRPWWKCPNYKNHPRE